MDFTKPIYGEVEGFIDAIAAKVYFKSHGIDLAISKALNEKKQFNETRWVKW